MLKTITILCPLFNDTESLNRLLREMEKTFDALNHYNFTVLIVDDGSTEPLRIQPSDSFSLQILHLQRNIGHQKALAIGLAYIKDQISCDKVLIMDSDGEDRPEDALQLLLTAEKRTSEVIFAQRGSRREDLIFKLFYLLYKISFQLLTGRRISFGNYMVLPKASLDKIVYYSEIWNHLAGGIVKSGIAYSTIQTHKGVRYAGRSKMNFGKLLLLGLGAISVFMEIIAGRLLIFSFLLIAISLLIILSLLGIKLFTQLAIPGWTSTVMSSTLIVLLQSFLLSLITMFLYFSSESQRKFVPAHHYKDYAGEVETIKS
ncbi:glycosyltransferase family 2 protein [Terrimonas pollutisoli]|uniref:glycosyltransferase family 2 protein n=1 Tax=Terrimonas pollutisoli TaxID=3034147 RepID=UPI0023EB8CD3|nr:glycosyltransferase family 2 protein [Terrimonas sp. H1YJ31]